MIAAIRKSLVLFFAFILIVPPSVADEVTIELKFRDPAWSGIVTFDDATGQPFRPNPKLPVYTIKSMDIAYRGVAGWDETEIVPEPGMRGVVVDRHGVAAIFIYAIDTATGVAVGGGIGYGPAPQGLPGDTIVISDLQFTDGNTIGYYWSSLPGARNIFGGIHFPAGARSFADKVVQYAPAGGGAGPDTTESDRLQILGSPENGYVSLGNGGQIVVRFLDNALIGSGDSAHDLYIFPAHSSTGGRIDVEIRKHNGKWIPLGKVSGRPYSGFDIDSAGFGPNDHAVEVRLTDDGSTPGDSAAPGSRLLAVGAHSTIAKTDKEGWLSYWISAHIGGKSDLILDGQELLWHHRRGTAPGLANASNINARSSNSPTIIDSNQGPTIEWVPSGWPAPLADGTHPESIVSLQDLTPVLPERDWCWNLEKLLGVGIVKIIQQPTKENGFALIIRFDDLGKGKNQYMSGGGLYSIRLRTAGRGC